MVSVKLIGIRLAILVKQFPVILIPFQIISFKYLSDFSLRKVSSIFIQIKIKT